MAEIKDFTSEQIEEAEEWYKYNTPELYEFAKRQVGVTDKSESNQYFLLIWLYNVYFQLKTISIELRPNQFIIGIDYNSSGNAEKDMEQAILGKIQFNLSFWNPHPKGMADQLAKDFLIAKLSTL